MNSYQKWTNHQSEEVNHRVYLFLCAMTSIANCEISSGISISSILDDLELSINWGIQNGWLIIENPIKMDDLGVPLFQETII